MDYLSFVKESRGVPFSVMVRMLIDREAKNDVEYVEIKKHEE